MKQKVKKSSQCIAPLTRIGETKIESGQLYTFSNGCKPLLVRYIWGKEVLQTYHRPFHVLTLSQLTTEYLSMLSEGKLVNS